MKNYNIDKQEEEITETVVEDVKKDFLPADNVITNVKIDVNGEKIPEGVTFSILQVLKDNKYSIGTDGKRYIVKGENLSLIK